MKLSLEYLNQRHAFWIHRIGDAGVWNPLAFNPVDIVIRKDSRRYNALFQRRVKHKAGRKEIEDKIVIYNKVEEFEPKFLDSILVHEMIHQYIIQNDLKDTRTHGKIFRNFMQRINRLFKDELQIRISERNPSLPLKGAGEKIHSLLLLQYENSEYFLAVVNPGKKEYFESLIKKNRRTWGIKKHFWAQSNDVYFNSYRRCTLSLHGLKKSLPEMTQFCREYNVKITSENQQ